VVDAPIRPFANTPEKNIEHAAKVHYANRPRGMRGKAAPAGADGPPAIVPAPRLAPTEASRRWAALLQQIFEVDPLACTTCQGAMRLVACIMQPSVINRILHPFGSRFPHHLGNARAGCEYLFLVITCRTRS